MASVEEDCHNNPNFAVICSFIIQFGETCGINLTIERLQEMLEDTKTLHEELRELHIKLLRKARKWFGKEKWEKALIKFCHQYSNVDAWEIERFGYKKAKLSVKLEALKRLLEMQFDTNSKFKTGINQQDASNLRLLPVGRDVKGLMYWYQVDEDLNLRIYSEEAENERSWKLLCKTRHDLATLLSSLEACGLQYVKDESSSVCSENGDSCITELSNKEKKPIKEELVENIVKQETSSINDKEDIKPQALDLSTTIAAKSENTTLENEEKLSLEIPVGAGITMKPCDVKTVSESQPMGIVVSSNKESPELSQIQNNVKTEETPVTEAGNSLLIDKSSHSDTNAETSKKELGHLKCQSVEQMQPLDLSRENNVEKNVQSVLIKEGISKLSHKQVQKQDKEELLSSHGGVSVTTVNMSTSKVPHTTEVSNHIGSVDILNSLVAEDSLSCKTSEGREFKHKIYYKKLDTHEKPELNLDKLSENTNSDKESVSQEKEIKIITECHLSLDSAKIAESLKNVPDANQKLNKDENNKKIVDLSSSTNDNRHSISKSEVLGSLSGENLTDSEAAKETDVNHVAKAENSNNDQADIKSEHSEQTAIKFSKEVNKPSVLAETNSEKDVCTSPLVNNENILQDKIDKLNTTKNPCAVSCNSTSEISTTIQELQTDCNEVDTIKSSTTHSLTIKEVDGIQDLQTSKNKESDSNKQSKINTDSLRVFEILQDSPGDENQINDNKKMNKAECDSTKENEDSAKKEQIENLSPQKKSDEQTKSYETVSVEAVPVESAEASTLENKTLDLEETVEEHKNAPKTKKKKSVRGRKLRSRKCNDMKKTAHKTPEKVIEKESGGDSESIESENNQKNLSCSEKKGEEASLTIPEEVILAAGKSPRRGRSRSRGRGRGRGRGRQVTRKGGLTPPSNSGTLKRGRGRGPKILNGSDGSDSPNLHIKRSRRIQEQQQKKLSELAEALEREQRHLEELAKKKVATTKEKSEPPAPPPDEETKENKKEKKKKRRRKRHRGKKRTSYNPWDVSSESTSSSEEEEFHVAEEEEEEDEEELKFDENYDEFACEEYDENEEPVIVKRARTAKKVHSDNESNSSSEMEGDDKPCGRCGQKDHPEWILLCDKCDSGYHTACLNPPLMIVPDGNWYCPPCEHKMLCEKLSETLKSLDQMMKKKEREELRKQRLAYVGISLDNVLKPEKKEKPESDECEEEKEESDKDDKLFSYRSSRPRRSVSYQFKEFDELINSAIEEDIIEGRGAGAGKGKDMSNITGAEERESKKRRKHRRLNDLDTTSEEGDSDVEYKDTSSDTEVSQSGGSDDYVVESDDSGWRKRSRKAGGRHRRKHHRRGKLDDFIDDEWDSDGSEEYRPCTRRAAQKNISYREISSDDDGDWGPIKKKPRRKWGSESESDKDWQGRKNKQGKRTSRKMRLSDSEETEEEEVSNGSSEESFINKSQKKRVSNSLRSRKDFSEGEMSEEEEEDRPKTRKKKINYSEMIASDNRCTEKSRRLKNSDISEDDETENDESSDSEESKDEGMTIGKKRRIIKSDDDDDEEEQQQPNDKEETITAENSMQKIGNEQKCDVVPDQSLSEITHEKLIELPAQRSVIKHSDSYLQKQQVSYIHPEATKSQNHSIKQQVPEVKTTLVTESPISNLGVSTIHLPHSLSAGTSVTVVQTPLTQSPGVVIPIVRPLHTQSPGIGVPVVRGPHPQSSGINVPVAGPPHQHSPAVGVPMVRGPHPLMSGAPVIGPSMPQSSGVSVSGTRSLHPQAACVSISGIRPSHPSSPNVPPIKAEALQSLGSFENKSSPIKPSLIETYPSSPSPSKLTSLDSSPSRLLPMDTYSRSSPYSQRSISPPSREYGSSSPPSDQYRPQGFGLSFSQDQYYGQGYIRPPNAGPYLPPTSGQESFRTQFMGPYAPAPSRPSEYFPNPVYYSPPGDSHGQPTNYSQTPPPGPTYYYSQSPQQQNGNYSVTPLQRPPASEGGEEGELTRVSDIFSYMAQD